MFFSNAVLASTTFGTCFKLALVAVVALDKGEIERDIIVDEVLVWWHGI